MSVVHVEVTYIKSDDNVIDVALLKERTLRAIDKVMEKCEGKERCIKTEHAFSITEGS